MPTRFPVAALMFASIVFAAACQKSDVMNADSGAAGGMMKAMPPTDSEVIVGESNVWRAVAAKDAAGFEMVAGTNWVYIDGNGIVRPRPGEASAIIAACETKSYSLSDETVRPVGTDAAVVTYRATVDQTCDGRKSPSPVYALTVWQRKGGKLQIAAHTETPVVPAPKK